MTDLSSRTAEELAEKARRFCMDGRTVNPKGEDAIAELVARAAALEAAEARLAEMTELREQAEVDTERKDQATIKARDRLSAALEQIEALYPMLAAGRGRAGLRTATKIAREALSSGPELETERPHKMTISAWKPVPASSPASPHNQMKETWQDALRTAENPDEECRAALRTLTKAVEREHRPNTPYSLNVREALAKAAAALQEGEKLPDDPNTRAWLGIEPQFPEEET